MKFLSLILILSAFTAAHSQQMVLPIARSIAVEEPLTIAAYFSGVALSCAHSTLMSKANISGCGSQFADTASAWFDDEPSSQQLSEAEQKKQAWLKKKEILCSMAKVATLCLAACYVIQNLQSTRPSFSVYQAETFLQQLAQNIIIPQATSYLIKKGSTELLPEELQAKRLVAWALVVLNSCLSYLAVVHMYAILQPPVMPTDGEHLLNFFGNYLAPNVCCKLFV